MRLVFCLRRGSNGYGVDIDSYNVIVGVHAGGQGSIDGLARSGDAALAVDGAPLTGASGLVERLSSGSNAYDVHVLRDAPALDELVSGALGESAASCVFRVLELPVRRDGGLGVTMAAGGRVSALVPGGPAELDGHLAAGDVVAWVDRKWVGSEPLTKFVPANRTAFRFTILRPLTGTELEEALRIFPPPAPRLSARQAGWPPSAGAECLVSCFTADCHNWPMDAALKRFELTGFPAFVRVTPSGEVRVFLASRRP